MNTDMYCFLRLCDIYECMKNRNGSFLVGLESNSFHVRRLALSMGGNIKDNINFMTDFSLDFATFKAKMYEVF